MLKVGDKIPKFEGLNQDGKLVRSSDFKDKKLIVYFYPRANTPGCTAQGCSIRDFYHQIKDKGYEIIGVSKDSVEKQKKFHTNNKFPFDIISDVDAQIIKAFGAWGKKKFMGKEYDGILRYTFIVDQKGVISQIITKVKTKIHAEQILGEISKK